MRSFLKQPFGSVLQQTLLIVLLFAGVLIVQPFSRQIYQVGLAILIGAALLEIGAGNIPANANFRSSILFLVLALVVIAIVFTAGILLVPSLVALGSAR